MRPKVILPIFLITVATLVLIQLTRPGPGNDTTLQDSAENTAIPTSNDIIEANSRAQGSNANEPLQSKQPGVSPEEESHEQYICRRTAELMDLAMSDDPASLKSILLDLNNSEAEIRDAAVIAAVQFKSADAIPALQDAYSRTDEPEEKVSIHKAIEFLESTANPDSATATK
jgi:hypothetical protein